MPGMPRTPLAVEIGAIGGSTLPRLGPPPMAYSRHPSRSSTLSPTFKWGWVDFTPSPTVPPVLTSFEPPTAPTETRGGVLASITFFEDRILRMLGGPGALRDHVTAMSREGWGPPRLPAHAQAGDQRVVVGAATDAAVVAQVDLRCVGDVGDGLQADHGGIACRGGAEHGEGVARRAGERRRDGPAGVGEFVLPAETNRNVELALVAEADRAREIGADRGAQRVGGLLRDVEAERLRARFAECILRHARDLQPPEWRDGGHRRRIDVDLVAALGLAEELVGAGRAGGGARLQAGDQDLAVQLG